ncbi:MAG: tetratricopeptide repeat protein [Armatimonadota bacterium]
MRVCVLLCLLCLAILLASLVWAAPSPADQAFAAANQLYRTGNYDQAVVSLKKFVANYPQDAQVHRATFMLGCSYQQLGQIPLAIAQLSQVTAKATGAQHARLRADAHFQLGDCYMQQNDLQNAAQAYDNALKLVTDDADFVAQARYLKASCLYQLGRGKDARPIYQQVVDTAPDHPLAPWCLYAVGVVALESSDYAAAITALEATLARYKDSEVVGDAKMKLGAAYLERARAAKDPAAADPDYRKAFPLLQAIVDDAQQPDDARMLAANLLARAYLDLNESDKAVTLCTQVLARTPNPSLPAALQLRLSRADAYYNAKRYAEAAGDYAAVAGDKNSPSQLQSLYWLANSRYQQGLANKDKTAFVAAIDSFTAFLKGDGAKTPQAVRAQLLIGLCCEELATLGDAAARMNAVNAYKIVAEKWPATPEANEANARIADQAGEMSAAELEKLAATLPPGEPLWNVLLRLGSEKYKAGQYNDVLALAQRMLDGKPAPATAARAAYMKALALVQLKRGKEAIPLFKQVAASPQAGELAAPAQRGLIQACLDAKQFTEAREAAKALAAQPIEAKTPAERESELANRLMLLAEAYIGTNQIADADAAYQRVLKECPASNRVPFALVNSAWVAETRKDLAKANTLYAEMLAKFPKHELAPEANFRLGSNLNELKEYEKAIAALQQVPKTYLNADTAAYKIAWAYRDWGKADEANARFKAVAEQFPKSPYAGAALFHQGEYAVEKEQYKEAQALLQRALELMAPDYNLRPNAQFKLGDCLYELKDFAGAAAAYGAVAANEKAGELAAEALFWKAKSLEDGDQPLPAREAFGQYVAKNPAGALVLDAQLGAGRAALAAKKTADARADLRKALDLCAELPEKHPVLAERAKSVAPEAQFLLGQAAMDEKAYDDALTQFALVGVYNMEPWYSRSLLHMARCSALAGNPAAAEKTLALLKKTFPDSDAARQIPQVAEEFKLKVE